MTNAEEKVLWEIRGSVRQAENCAIWNDKEGLKQALLRAQREIDGLLGLQETISPVVIPTNQQR